MWEGQGRRKEKFARLRHPDGTHENLFINGSLESTACRPSSLARHAA